MHLLPSLGALAEAPGQEHSRLARSLGLPGSATREEFTQLFVIQLFPYASFYLTASGLPSADVRSDVAEFFRRLDADVPAESDHLSVLLQWYRLTDRAVAAPPQLRHAFYWGVLASWLPVYLLRVRELGAPFYRAWAAVLLDALEAEATRNGPPALLPHYLAAAPPLPSIRDAAAFVNALFAPVVSGLILCRADLGRCAQEHGLAVRVADRRQTLKYFLADNCADVCTWLAAEAERQADTINALPEPFAPVRTVWAERAVQSARMIREFASLYARQQPFSL